jgi:hypothetical protein
MGQRLLIRVHPCLSVVEFLGLRLAALRPCAFALSKVAHSIAGERHLMQRRKGSRTQRFSMLILDAFALGWMKEHLSGRTKFVTLVPDKEKN